MGIFQDESSFAFLYLIFQLLAQSELKLLKIKIVCFVQDHQDTDLIIQNREENNNCYEEQDNNIPPDFYSLPVIQPAKNIRNIFCYL